TGQQVQPADHPRLTGPGFTGDRAESLIQLQLRVLDHPELLDAQLGQHAVHTTNLHYSARPDERVRTESARGRTRSTLVASAPTLHRQIELVHQPIRERLIAQPHQAHRRPPRDDLDPGPLRELDAAQTVTDQHSGEPV